jgi:DNA polymerase I
VLAGDEKLIEDFNSDVDIHAKTAAETYGISIDEVSKSQRRAAKWKAFVRNCRLS